IDPGKDLLFDYPGLHTLATRYLATDHDKNVYELPQERWLTIALHLMQDEPKERRSLLVREAYWALSNLYMTVATPTLANAGLSHGQLSSCFIDTVSDSLIDIYNSNTDVARLSKDGGGIGVYLGKVRSRGSDIKGFKGASSGIVPWTRQLNNTAVSVDQLGRRKGAVCVYLDVWHPDILSFLDLKLNNGDERQRAHDIFTGVCIPDLFMEQVEKRGDWYLFDPHEVRRVMGFSLEDYYDERLGGGSFREKYEACIRNDRLRKQKIPAMQNMIRIMKSQLETGTPFMFYRDRVNRMNPNKHAGMIYASNLCTEIAQNMSPTVQYEETIDGDTIITYKKAGDFVVCNLSSINLGKAVPDGVLERLIPIQVRMLDNVIDLNTISVKQASHTNKKYRAIGLGTFGWHHLLALKGIPWESEEAVELADRLYEKIARLTIRASAELAKEKGAYPLFEGSEWQTGEYFEKKGYLSGDSAEEWGEIREMVRRWG
ncbi:MAG: ribonucleoside-diphosphate reductase subunit alpha, partial [Planifilum fimeticola]